MNGIDADDEEQQVLRGVLEEGYRRQHREVFEVQSSPDVDYRVAAKRRLDVLERMLIKAGSSPSRAMKAIHR